MSGLLTVPRIRLCFHQTPFAPFHEDDVLPSLLKSLKIFKSIARDQLKYLLSSCRLEYAMEPMVHIWSGYMGPGGATTGPLPDYVPFVQAWSN